MADFGVMQPNIERAPAFADALIIKINKVRGVSFIDFAECVPVQYFIDHAINDPSIAYVFQDQL